MSKLTNKEKAQSADFIINCEMFGIKPTTRQAAKHSNKIGSLWKLSHGVPLNACLNPTLKSKK